MKSFMVKIHVFFLIVLLSAFSCTYNKGADIKPDVGCSTTYSTVSFSTDIQPILTLNCAISGCHSGTNPQGNFNLEASKAYTTLSKTGRGYIDVSDPKGSVFYSSMVSTSNPMPPAGRQPISACDLKRIETWMREGALDN